MSNALTKADVDLAHRMFQIIQQAKEDLGRSCMTIGKALHLVRENRLHGAWAEGCDTFDDFITEMGLKHTFAYNCMRVYREFGALDVTGIPHDRLVRLLPLHLKEQEKPEWVEKARELPAYGLNDEIREKRLQQALDTCDHPEFLPMLKCTKCGRILSVNDRRYKRRYSDVDNEGI
jgi:hypothetical protein